jgi:hypothetical protein
MLINQGEAAYNLFENGSTEGEIILKGGLAKANAIISDLPHYQELQESTCLRATVARASNFNTVAYVG